MVRKDLKIKENTGKNEALTVLKSPLFAFRLQKTYGRIKAKVLKFLSRGEGPWGPSGSGGPVAFFFKDLPLKDPQNSNFAQLPEATQNTSGVQQTAQNC